MAGQPVEVEVLSPTGKPIGAADASQVRIDGVPGARRILQFPKAGRRLLPISYVDKHEHSVEVAFHEVTVARAPLVGPAPVKWPGIGLALLKAYPVTYAPYTVYFAVGELGPLDRRIWGSPVVSAEGPTLPSATLDPRARRGRGPGRYRWDFGDGKTVTTDIPVAQHNFTDAMDIDLSSQSFEVKVTTDGGRAVCGTLVIQNAHNLMKERLGIIGLLTDPEEFATPTKDGYRGVLTVRNSAKCVVTLKQVALAPTHHSGEPAVEWVRFALDPAVPVPAKGEARVAVKVRREHLGDGPIGFAICLGGKTDDGLKARASAYFDLAPGAGDVPINDPEAGESRLPASARKGLAKLLGDATDGSVGLSDLKAEVGRGGVKNLQKAMATLSAESHKPNSNRAGKALDDRMSFRPGRFLNALKGDIVLVPQGSDIIGQLLSRLKFHQFYCHSGIMVDDLSSISHCTMSTDRLQNHISLPFFWRGVDPQAVRYGWPGAVTQSVQNAVEGGQKLRDPDGLGSYEICCFAGRPDVKLPDDNWQVVVPLVVKPDPFAETPEIRGNLHEIADDAAAHAMISKPLVHYRLFQYTDPTIGRNPPAPASNKWWSGTLPGVCSSFIWLMMKRAGVQLAGPSPITRDGDLKKEDKDAGATVGEATPDGLYHYNAADRRSAGEWLYKEIQPLVPRLVAGIGHMAIHVANEFVNSFALDRTRLDDDQPLWEFTAEADAVSPSNILFWKGPDTLEGGVLGYFEPVCYRQPRFARAASPATL